MRKAKTAPATLTMLAVLFFGGCGGNEPASEATGGVVAAPATLPQLNEDTASLFADLALKGIQREYPNKIGHVLNDESDVGSPAELHPAFYGSFDWHSAVHGHWMLVKLLKLFPDLPDQKKIRAALEANLARENILTELEYFNQPNRRSFERTYGWAWLLKLREELYSWNDVDGARWSKNIEPLANGIVERYLDFLPRQDYPIRRGVHPNTAFGLAFALDYARATDHGNLEDLVIERSRSYFLEDSDYPARWEPDGDDFFSRSLIEADLMRRVLDADEFGAWFNRFLPNLEQGRPTSLLEPAEVSDRSDPKIVHLDGLNLSRAWCMLSIAQALSDEDPRKATLTRSAALHANATLPHITSGHYEGEHWLATFAIFMLTVS